MLDQKIFEDKPETLENDKNTGEETTSSKIEEENENVTQKELYHLLPKYISMGYAVCNSMNCV